jgi:hypothetical protein
MLDWMFLILLIIAFLMIIFCLKTDEEEPYWKILFIVISTVIWFILALSNLNIVTPYSIYNATTGNTTMGYSPYVDEGSTYMTYFFGLMGVLCMIYVIVILFDIYYWRLDNQDKEE